MQAVVSEAERVRIVQLVNDTFGPNHAPNMLKIMYCETGGVPTKINHGDAKITGYPSWGLFQINAPEFTDWDKPEVNVLRAKRKLETQGYRAWFNCAKKNQLI